MHTIELDDFDIAILRALQSNSAYTNADLASIAHLSASQCSRRRQRLETEGLITGYRAQLNAGLLGFGFRAITRVNLGVHSEAHASRFASFLKKQPEIRAAFSVSGDADYVLIICTADLPAFADFIHNRLLPHPQIQHVRSEIVLMTLKDENGVPL